MVQKNLAQAAPARGRPRSFDTDEVLGQVRDAFWRYGYAGTSMDQLSAATGLHKPSLYGAFGDKKRLYLAALDNYLAEVRAQFARGLRRAGAVRIAARDDRMVDRQVPATMATAPAAAS